jgi:hypothetical protein
MGTRTLSDAQVAEVLRRWKNDERQVDIALDYGVPKHIIQQVIKTHNAQKRSMFRSEAGQPVRQDAEKRLQEKRMRERQLPPDTRTRWEQWMPRPGLSALDQKQAQEAAE